MMPSTRYDAARHAWVDMTDAERARMSADYNLRVGLMMAALSFGADPGIQRVSMHIDSIGLEEAVVEQDSAISELMSEALAAFERIRTGDMGVSGSKADPKDGDFHGDPSRPVTPKTADLGVDGGDGDDADDSLNRQFEDLIKDIDFDEMTFAVPDEAANESTGEEGDSEHFTHDGLDAGLIGYNDFDGDGDDPLSQLRKNPTVRNLVTVTFTRGEFMERLGECGLSDPTGTYRMFDAEMDVDGLGALKPVDAALNLRDSRFSPA